MDKATRAKFAIYLGICATNTIVTQIMLVLGAEISGVPVWMILTFSHVILRGIATLSILL